MKVDVTCLLLGLCASLACPSLAATQLEPMETDVLVVGGTFKGVEAAVEAKRAGAADVFLMTPYTYLGEDLAGTRELGFDRVEPPSDPLMRRLWEDTDDQIPFSYKPSRYTNHPRAVYRNDWLERLSEPSVPRSPTDAVYYEHDVSYACRLSEKSAVGAVEVIVFESDKAVGSAQSDESGNPKAGFDNKFRGVVRTSAVTCRVSGGSLTGTTLTLKPVSSFIVKGDSYHHDIKAVVWSAPADGSISAAVIEVTKDPRAHHQFIARLRFHRPDARAVTRPPTPLKAKRTLDAALLGAGVRFITTTFVRNVLRDEKGEIVGIEAVNRSGRRVIRAKRVIDATRYGILANFGHGVPSLAGRQTFSRILLTDGPAPAFDGVKVESFGKPMPVSNSRAVGRFSRCTFTLDLKDGTYPSLAAAEWEAREKTWTPAMMDDADLLVWHPADAAAQPPKVSQPVRTLQELPLWGEYDVVVVGGGTSGSPAAIAAARSGAKTLLVEYLNVLGGVGTDGMVLGYYDGNHCGFTTKFKEANVKIGGRFGLYKRAQTWRQWCREAGVTVWLGGMGTDAVVENGKVVAVEVATPFGCGLVRAKAFVDATGNADVAAAAGAKTTFLSEKEFALQSAGQSPRRLGRGGINSDFGYVDDSNAWDLWLFGLRARAGAPNAWDIAKMPDSRERRKVVPDYAVNAQDVTSCRPFPDVVVQALSRQDSHGYLTDDFRFVSESSAILEETKNDGIRAKYNVNVPLRSLLPKGLSGLAVVGLGAGCARDVLPMVRMQADLMNMGYAVGIAAAKAAQKGGEYRAIDYAALRGELIDFGILREETRGWQADVDVSSDALIAAAAKTAGADFTGSHVLFRPENRARAVAPLKAAYAAAATPMERQNLAKMLGLLGDPTGAELLADIVAGRRRILPLKLKGAFGNQGDNLDGFMLALGRTRSPLALKPLVKRLDGVGKAAIAGRFRGVTLALEALGDPAAAPAIEACMRANGVSGHAVKDAAQLAPLGGYGVGGEFDVCIRELAFARTLMACGDPSGLGRRTLEAYAQDPRGVFSAHAKAVLSLRR